MWVFTQHAMQRIQERDYSMDEVAAVLNGEVPTIIYPSPRDSGVDLYFGCVGSKFIMIPVDRIRKTVITIRPMHTSEKTVYLKEAGL